jgi:hypothetical protein
MLTVGDQESLVGSFGSHESFNMKLGDISNINVSSSTDDSVLVLFCSVEIGIESTNGGVQRLRGGTFVDDRSKHERGVDSSDIEWSLSINSVFFQEFPSSSFGKLRESAKSV